MSTIASVQHPPFPAARSRRRVPVIPGTRLGMWVFLASEVGTFGGLVAAYVLMRMWHREWLRESAHTLLSIGTINTVILLTSSLTMVLAHQAAEELDRPRAKKFLLRTMGLGVLFLGFKAFEYHHEIQGGHTPRASVFWSFYFAMTGLHALHIVGGLSLMLYAVLGLKHDPRPASRRPDRAVLAFRGRRLDRPVPAPVRHHPLIARKVESCRPPCPTQPPPMPTRTTRRSG